ncbi:hypothetical protein [Algoriphagus sp. A40]|uniref:hypothetical protein n=1 Tax=Algoriphagus sp. A40 TaxID=1945863 RepID=UPI001C2B8182|nr:hypothetical protein [Algoriphagus sp. A40]
MKAISGGLFVYWAMGKYEKLLLKILQGRSDHNISFDEFRTILGLFGFTERVKGSHHIFYKKEVEEIINLQETQGKAKAYQVKQV